MTIFISIASFRDPELPYTIKSAIDNASNPENLHFGVVYQGLPLEMPNFDSVPNLSLVTMHSKEARGAGYA